MNVALHGGIVTEPYCKSFISDGNGTRDNIAPSSCLESPVLLSIRRCVRKNSNVAIWAIALTGDELTIASQAAASGGANEIKWKRVK